MKYIIETELKVKKLLVVEADNYDYAVKKIDRMRQYTFDMGLNERKNTEVISCRDVTNEFMKENRLKSIDGIRVNLA